MTCRICKGTGVVTEVLSQVGEPQDYEPVDCPACTQEDMVSELPAGYDAWRTREPDADPDPIEGEFVVTLTLSLDVLLPDDQGELSWADERQLEAQRLARRIEKVLNLHGDELGLTIGFIDAQVNCVTNA